jgi:TolB-like protein
MARLPLDSVAIIGRHDGRLRSRVVAQTLADDLSAMLARSRYLRVPRAEFVAPYAATDLTPEEIGRELSVRGAVLLTVAAEAPRVNVAAELIDVHREELVTRQHFLVSHHELIALERRILRMFSANCVRHPITDDEDEYARLVEARFARAAGAWSEALAILDTLVTPAASLEFAAVVVEGPVKERVDEARARLALAPSAAALVWGAKLRIRFDDDWNGAEEALRHALAIDPVCAEAHAILGDLLVANGKNDEGSMHHRVLAELMPLGVVDNFSVRFTSNLLRA